MALFPVPSPIAAVLPLHNPSPVQRTWATLGLPENGWVLVTDEALCSACAESDVQPCVSACITAHHLPFEERMRMGTCGQCSPAPCESICPVDAISHTTQGVVEVDQELCIGCQFCIDVCPNDALLFVDGYGQAIPPFGVRGYRTGAPYGVLPNTVAKCTFCSARLQQSAMPVCSDACSLGAIWVGNLNRDTATNGRQVVRLSELMANRQIRPTNPGQRQIALL